MKKILLCLFTYNRLALVKNAVHSINTFFPWGDCKVIDDGSSDPEVKKFLDKTVAEHSRWSYQIMPRTQGRMYGGYYKNMRFGLQFALEHGYDYCFFFEDDEQLVWKKDDYLEYIERVFSTCPDAIQIQPLLFRRILRYHTNVEYIRTAHAYRTERGFSTSAIWNLEAVRKNPDYKFISEYGDGLPANSGYWLSKGYRLYLQFDPTVAIIPWVTTRMLETHPPELDKTNGNAFLLNPLTSQELNFLQKRDPSIPAYQEYFQLSKETTARPIWHQKNCRMPRYYELCRSIVKEENQFKQSPLRIPILDNWQPTTIPPVASHLTWKNTEIIPPSRTFLGRIIPQKLKRQIRELLSYNLFDFFGYQELCRRLHGEQRTLILKSREK